MLEYSLDNLLEAFDNVDVDGTLEFSVPGSYLYPPETKGRRNIARQLICSFFHSQPLALVRFQLVKSFLDEVLLGLCQTEEGHWVLKLNFAKLMLLPCANPTEELAELRKLFEELKSLIALDPLRLVTAQICNERSKGKKVYGSIKFEYRSEPGVSTPDRTVEANERLAALVEGSPLIQEYLRQVALALGKMGPWSWAMMGEQHLYGYAKGPWSDAFYARNADK